MSKLQFRVLYRAFLFRIVDIELLSADAYGDSNTLLGQFAALLVFFSLLLAWPGLILIAGWMPPFARLILGLTIEHLIVATTMLAVGLFAVLSWDSTFPDRRDVLVLVPLPIRGRTLFLTKVAASGAALAVTIAVINSLAGLVWPFVLHPEGGGFLRLVRSFAAYWGTMFAAGLFIYCSVLCVQGFSAQIFSRRIFLRLSAFLQVAAFILFVSVYFLQPPFESLSELVDPQRQRLLAWLPSYWFLGLLQQLNGTLPPALAPLAHRAWAGLAIATCGAAVAFFLSWFRTLRKIVEEPDIVPGAGGANWLPRFGNAVETAIVQFSIRTLVRSRQHRLILAFYSGIGFAIVVFSLKAPEVQRQLLAASTTLMGHRVNAPLLASTAVMLGFWLAGTRIIFAMPVNLKANWVFRIAPIRGAVQCLRATRRALFVLGLLPVWAAVAAMLFYIWPWRLAAEHLIVLGLIGVTLAHLLLHNFRKIPFTCSYLPGRSNVHVTLWLSILLIIDMTDFGAQRELRAFADFRHSAWMLGILCVAALLTKWMTSVPKWDDGPLEFEKIPPSQVIALGLPSDGGLA